MYMTMKTQVHRETAGNGKSDRAGTGGAGHCKRIKEIVGKEQIVDKEKKEYRSVEYGDIVILLRTAWMGRNIQGSAGISGDSRILYIKNRIFLCNRDCDCIELSEGV